MPSTFRRGDRNLVSVVSQDTAVASLRIEPRGARHVWPRSCGRHACGAAGGVRPSQQPRHLSSLWLEDRVAPCAPRYADTSSRALLDESRHPGSSHGASLGSWPAAAVSYTHLRAHETRHDLVCRLLLE